MRRAAVALANLSRTPRSISVRPTSLADATKFTIAQFGGIDIIVNTAAIYPVPGPDGELADAQWARLSW